MTMKRLIAFLLLALCLSGLTASAEEFSPLPMDSYAPGPAPRDENYLSSTEYQDESISVKIYEDRYADTDYLYAHIKISHPSQLRTASAGMVNSARATFTSTDTARGRYVAKAVNAVISINGDYHTKTDKCKVVLRQGIQVRNAADDSSLLIIDYNGNFSVLQHCSKEDYAKYYEQHADEMYNVFCFGPLLVQDGSSVIDPDYYNGFIGSNSGAKRSAIGQLGPLEYVIFTCACSKTEETQKYDKGFTIQEFAEVCELVGKRFSEDGFRIVYNLDGGTSTTMNFKRLDTKSGKLSYVKVNPGQERYLSDIIYFATLVK